jgi:hypothetical protein
MRRYGPAIFAAGLVVVDAVATTAWSGVDSVSVALLLFAVVGALIVWRQPGNRMGWVFAGIGLVVAVGGALQGYAENVLPDADHLNPLTFLAAWVTAWWWFPLLGLMVIFVPLLFPTGRLVSPRWRWLARLATLDLIALGLMNAFAPTLSGDGYKIDNPIGLSLHMDPEHSPAGGAVMGVFLVCLVGAVISLIVRFRRSRGIERQQLKWFLLATMVMPVTIFLQSMIHTGFFQNSDLPGSIAMGAVPVGAGIAILRYGLYEIDVVINKALVYGALTAALAFGYLGIVALVEQVLPFEGNGIAVAGSTLAMAAAFAPLRRRIQSFVDRRFYRHKYDSSREVEAFGARLRQEVNLEDVIGDLRAVVADTMQPVSVSVWIRPPRGEAAS